MLSQKLTFFSFKADILERSYFEAKYMYLGYIEKVRLFADKTTVQYFLLKPQLDL